MGGGAGDVMAVTRHEQPIDALVAGDSVGAADVTFAIWHILAAEGDEPC